MLDGQLKVLRNQLQSWSVGHSTALGEYPHANGVLRYCIRNCWRAVLGDKVDFIIDFLNVCISLSAAPFEAGWLGAPVKWIIPLDLHHSWNSSDVNYVTLSITSVYEYPKCTRSCSINSIVALKDVELQSQPKVSGHPQTKVLPRFPSFNVATMMSTFLSIFFWTCKTTLGRGYGGKGSHCPMLLSEIVWKNYVKYVVSFYVMWISTLLQSHVRAKPVQRWRCTILNKIITAATAVELHGNRCSLNHVGMNL